MIEYFHDACAVRILEMSVRQVVLWQGRCIMYALSLGFVTPSESCEYALFK